MKKIVLASISLVFVFSVVAVLMAQKPASMPAAKGEQLSRHILKDSPYTEWSLFPGTKKLYKGTEPHGALLTTYVNDVALDSIKKKKAFGEGSIIVKENYMPDKKLAALTVMYKVKSFNPEAGDWFWLKTTPDGRVEDSGKMAMCIACHAKVKAKDYVFTKMPK